MSRGGGAQVALSCESTGDRLWTRGYTYIVALDWQGYWLRMAPSTGTLIHLVARDGKQDEVATILGQAIAGVARDALAATWYARGAKPSASRSSD